MSTVNLVLDIVLVLAAIWMVVTVRGLGGVVGRALSLVTVGAVVLGVAHLFTTVQQNVFPMDGPQSSFLHRVVVLAGYVILVLGLRGVRELKA
jgi:hypothetical protein